jgi:hypothetical protein
MSNHIIQRDTVFMDLVSEFKKIPFKTGMKLIYAYLNQDPLAMIQFVLIGRITEVPPPTAEIQRTRKRYLLLSAPNFSLTSLQAYDLAKKDGKIEDYFSELMSQPVVIPESAFNAFIVNEVELSLDPDSELYWKSEKNSSKLADNIMKVSSIEHSRR